MDLAEVVEFYTYDKHHFPTLGDTDCSHAKWFLWREQSMGNDSVLVAEWCYYSRWDLFELISVKVYERGNTHTNKCSLLITDNKNLLSLQTYNYVYKIEIFNKFRW